MLESIVDASAYDLLLSLATPSANARRKSQQQQALRIQLLPDGACQTLMTSSRSSWQICLSKCCLSIKGGALNPIFLYLLLVKKIAHNR